MVSNDTDIFHGILCCSWKTARANRRGESHGASLLLLSLRCSIQYNRRAHSTHHTCIHLWKFFNSEQWYAHNNIRLDWIHQPFIFSLLLLLSLYWSMQYNRSAHRTHHSCIHLQTLCNSEQWYEHNNTRLDWIHNPFIFSYSCLYTCCSIVNWVSIMNLFWKFENAWMLGQIFVFPTSDP